MCIKKKKIYTPLLLLDRLPDCLGQQVVSVSRYGKRNKCYLQIRNHHHIIIITVFPCIKLEHVLHETAVLACITFLSYLGLKLHGMSKKVMEDPWQLIAAPFTILKKSFTFCA